MRIDERRRQLIFLEMDVIIGFAVLLDICGQGLRQRDRVPR